MGIIVRFTDIEDNTEAIIVATAINYDETKSEVYLTSSEFDVVVTNIHSYEYTDMLNTIMREGKLNIQNRMAYYDYSDSEE